MRFIILLLTLSLSMHSYAQQRIVSLSPIASKALTVLGVSDLVVGCTKWCPFAEDKLIVANAIDVNVEQVLLLKPDIILTSTLTSQENVNTLKRLGLNVVELKRTTSFEDMCDELTTIGSHVGRLELAQNEVTHAKQRLAEVQQNIDYSKQPKVMFQVGSKPVFVAIPNTFVNDYIIQAGGVNVFDELTHGSVTRESVVLRNPDAVFISTMPSAADDDKAIWYSFEDMSASKNNKIVYIEQEKASSPTIHTFVEVVELMIDILY